jgi:hypothetical protein
LSALPCGRPAGSLMSSSVVWKNSLPPASRWPVLARDAGLAGRAPVLVGGQRVEVAADLARIARHLAHALLVVVQFLQRDHRQEDVVFLEAEQAHRVVHQHVGVQHEQLGGPGAACAARARGARAWRRRRRGAGVAQGLPARAPPRRAAWRPGRRLGCAARRSVVVAGRAPRAGAARPQPGPSSERLSALRPACASKSAAASRSPFLDGGLGRGMGWVSLGMKESKKAAQAAVRLSRGEGRLRRRMAPPCETAGRLRRPSSGPSPP